MDDSNAHQVLINDNSFLLEQMYSDVSYKLPVSGYTILLTLSHYNYVSIYESLSIAEKYLKYSADIPDWWLEVNRHPTELMWNDLLHVDGETVITTDTFLTVLCKKLKIIHYLTEQHPDKIDRHWSNLFDVLFNDVNSILRTYIDITTK